MTDPNNIGFLLQQNNDDKVKMMSFPSLIDLISRQTGTSTQGNTGSIGDIGPQGNTGLVGPTGANGNIGATGAVGEVGSTGISVIGPTGLKGFQGIIGPTGPQGAQGADTFGPTGAQGIQGPIGDTGIGATAYVQLIDTPDNLNDFRHALIVNSGATGVSHTSTRAIIAGPGIATGKYSLTICGGNATANYQCDINSSGTASGKFIFRVHSDGDVNGSYITAINSSFTSATGAFPTIIQSSGGTINCSSNSSILASNNCSSMSNKGTIMASLDSTTSGPLNVIMASDNCHSSRGVESSRTFIGASRGVYIGENSDAEGSSSIACDSTGATGIIIDGKNSCVISSIENVEISSNYASVVASNNINLMGNNSSAISSNNGSIVANFGTIVASGGAVENSIAASAGFGSIVACNELCSIEGDEYSTIIASTLCTHEVGSKTSFILACNTCTNSSKYCHISASSDCDITSTNSAYSHIIGSESCVISATGPTRTGIISSKNCEISGNATNSEIMACESCTIPAVNQSSIIACDGVTNSGNYSAVICGNGSAFNNSADYACRVPTLSYNTLTVLSDKKLKKDIQKIVPEDEIFDRVMNLKTKEFHFNHQDERLPKTRGFIAQEVLELFPNVVRDNQVKRIPVEKVNNNWIRKDTLNNLSDDQLDRLYDLGGDRGWIMFEDHEPDWLGIDSSQIFTIALQTIQMLKEKDTKLGDIIGDLRKLIESL